jgi:hypothetical protein
VIDMAVAGSLVPFFQDFQDEPHPLGEAFVEIRRKLYPNTPELALWASEKSAFPETLTCVPPGPIV